MTALNRKLIRDLIHLRGQVIAVTLVVEARIIIWEAESVLKVPASALFRYGEGWSVFVIEDGRARRREVEIGHRSQLEVEVLSGVEEGAPVILHPTNRINDGSRVENR